MTTLLSFFSTDPCLVTSSAECSYNHSTHTHQLYWLRYHSQDCNRPKRIEQLRAGSYTSAGKEVLSSKPVLELA